jgi:hypothetical protein
MLDKSSNDDRFVDALKAELDKTARMLANAKRHLSAQQAQVGASSPSVPVSFMASRRVPSHSPVRRT